MSASPATRSATRLRGHCGRVPLQPGPTPGPVGAGTTWKCRARYRRNPTQAPTLFIAMNQSFVGRQPIFDRHLDVHGYELLFRAGNLSKAPRFFSSAQATSQVILNTFVEIGLERIVEDRRAFINFGQDILLNKGLRSLPLPPDRVVLEILEDVTVSDKLIAAAKRLAAQGYKLALDDFVYHPRWEPLLAVADIVKIDVQALAYPEIAEQVRFLARRGVRLLAEKVETRLEFERFKGLGFDYFQGYFLSRPTVVSGTRVPENRLASLQLLARLRDPDVEMERLVDLVKQDTALSYRLLRCANSVVFGPRHNVESIHEAVLRMGLRRLQQWTTLIVLAANDDKPHELIRIALARAAMCDRLGRAIGAPDSEVYFTAGLFSVLDALMDVSLSEVLVRLPISDALSGAILRHEGRPGQALRCTLAYEQGEWSDVAFAGLDAARIREAYTRALQWSRSVSQSLVGG